MAVFPKGRSFVQAVLEAVTRAGMASVDMQYFAAREGKPAEYCFERVCDSEIYVAVIGLRYGSIVPGRTISYTELEFEAASACGLPRLVFLLDETADLPAGMLDGDRRLIDGFRQRLRDAGMIVRSFASDAGLELEVFHALRDVTLGSLPATTTLSADTSAFTGRRDQVDAITRAARAASEAGQVVAIHAIDGMPGVGKTALAVHVGHLVAEYFPDRQLLVDLHGHTPGQQPTAPADALAALLAADGVDPRYLPDDLDRRAERWRSRMAGKRVLLILDNAASSEQVTPLLPGAPGCLVLVTSRRYLGDLPGAVVEIPLDVLPPGDAQAMFMNHADRTVGNTAIVAELVGLCGYLPLAILLLARVFTRHRSWSLEDLMTETRARLLVVSAENRTVAAAFELSYQYLSAGRKRFLRYLGLHPGPDIDAYAAAALAGLPLDQAAEHLDGLNSDRLLAEPLPGRYQMHDLIRQFARSRAADEPVSDQAQATGRLLDYYQYTADAADTWIARDPRPAVSSPVLAPAATPRLSSRDVAREWMTAERGNLLACIDYAVARHDDARVAGLTTAVACYLRDNGPWPLAITAHTAAAAAARRIGDEPGEASALRSLGDIRQVSGDYEGGRAVLEQARDISRRVADRPGEASALRHLGHIQQVTGDYAGASALLERARAISRSISDRLGEANALRTQGSIARFTGDYPGATAMLQQALAIYRELGNRSGEATSQLFLGEVLRMTGNYPGAISALDQSQDISRQTGDRLAEAYALLCLGAVRQMTGDYPGAIGALEQARDISRDLGDPSGHAHALLYLGPVVQATGDYQRATDALERARDIYDDLGNRPGVAGALVYLGEVRRRTGNYPAATQALEQARDIYRNLDNPPGEATALCHLGATQSMTGQAAAAATLKHALGLSQRLKDLPGQAETLNHIGTMHLRNGEFQNALIHYQDAFKIAHKIGFPLEEARALEGIGWCAKMTESTASANNALWQALKIYQRIGASEASRLGPEMSDPQQPRVPGDTISEPSERWS